MKNKILPLNKEPILHSYIHYSNSMAIITNPYIYNDIDLIYNNTIKFNSIDKDIVHYECNVESQQNEYKSINLSSIKDTKDKFVYCYNKVSGDGEYIFEIQSQKIINIGSECGILLTESLPEQDNFYPTNSYKLFYCGAKKIRSMRSIYDVEHFNNYSEHALPVWLKVKKEDHKIIAEISDDGNVWTFLEEKLVDFNDDSFYIGTYLEPKTFTYYNWLYSNYIQLHCDTHLGTHGNMSDVELDMFNGFKKRGNYLLNHPFLFTEIIEKSDIMYLTDIIKFIERAIDNEKYIQLMLNEKYVPDRPTYDVVDFAHLNLIYGYDDEKEILYLMGYNADGYYISSEITFDEFYKAVSSGIPDADKVKEDYITLISISSPDFKYEINIDLIITFLQDYLNGYNTYKRYGLINAPPDNRIFGINIYDCFIENIDAVIYNKRIIYSFLEHKFLMVKRIEYLYQNGVYAESDYNELNNIFTAVYKSTEKLQNMIFKELLISKGVNGIASDRKDKLVALILHIKDDETKAFNLLIDTLVKTSHSLT